MPAGFEVSAALWTAPILALVRRRLCLRLRTRRSVNEPYAAGAPMRGLRAWNNLHPLARTNNTPMTQAVQAADWNPVS